MTIREYLKSLGATDNELTAKVVTRMEQAMLFDSDLAQFKPDTVVSVITKAAEGLDRAYNDAKSHEFMAGQITRELERLINVAKAENQELKDQINGVGGLKINDGATKDAVMAYATVLRATQEIFGAENMTSDVMVAAINAGSFTAWRSIMGPKDDFKTAGRRL